MTPNPCFPIFKWAFRWLSAASVIFLATEALAVLGEAPSSIDSDRVALSGVHKRSSRRSGYSVHEFEVSGTMIREYVSSAGMVFGVAWTGLNHPDLKTLLGNYEPEYRKGLRAKPRVQGPRNRRLKTRNLVVETWGHMRKLEGRAYLPSLLPWGVDVHDIR